MIKEKIRSNNCIIYVVIVGVALIVLGGIPRAYAISPCLDTDDDMCVSGFEQGCDDGKEDHDANLPADYHYDLSSGDGDWIRGYVAGYYEAYQGLYSSECS